MIPMMNGFAYFEPCPILLALPLAAATCESLAELELADTSITAAQLVVAGKFLPPGTAPSPAADSIINSLPELCRVERVIAAGQPDPASGEIVAAFVVLREGCHAEREELRELATERFADYKVPEKFVFLPDLPKGPTGKVHRRSLREMALAASGTMFASDSPKRL